MTTKSENVTEIELLNARIRVMEKAAKKAKKAKKKAKQAKKDKADNFQGIWMQDGENGPYPGGVIKSPKGEKIWLCIFPNKYFKKKGKWPAYHVTVNTLKPKKTTK